MAFKNVLDESIRSLVEALGKDLHSIYLYGSVGRGTATFGESDLDLSVIVYSKLSIEVKEKLEQIEEQVSKRNDAISKLEFDIGTFDEAMIRNEFAWQFFLKHLCCCVWGEDLRGRIAPYKPSLKIGLEMNKDIGVRLTKTRKCLTDTNFRTQGRAIAKKILRTHYSILSERDNSWYESLSDIAECIKHYEPDLSQKIDLSLRIALGSASSTDEVMTLLEEYGSLVVTRFTQSGGFVLT